MPANKSKRKNPQSSPTGGSAKPLPCPTASVGGEGGCEEQAAKRIKTEKFYHSVYWDQERHVLKLVDQKILPASFKTIEVNSCEDVARHIKRMTVRGAPAIGAAGAYGFAMAVRDRQNNSTVSFLKEMQSKKELLDASRPTAVNLTWATGIMFKLVESMVCLPCSQFSPKPYSYSLFAP